jgi:pimeloyl-ACP methyl ester carboxylesterase
VNGEITLRGRRYRYLDAGSGPPLLLFHGWSGASDNFTAWLPPLVARFRVVIPDLPGCAGAPLLDEPHTAAAYARFGHELARALDLGPLAVGGLCSGASIAMAFASGQRDETTALLLHTPFIHPRVIRRRMRVQMRLLGSPAGVLYDVLRRSETLSGVYRRFTDGGNVATEEELRNARNLARADGRAARELAADLLRGDHRAFLRSWRRPLVVIAAEADAFVALAPLRQELAAIAPAPRVVILAGGHGWTPAYVSQQAAALADAAEALAKSDDRRTRLGG